MIDLTTRIVAAYVAKNPITVDGLADLIRTTYAALLNTSTAEQPVPEKGQPAVPIKKSVKPDAIHCLECGKGQKMLKRHLAAAHGLTVDEYRAKWSLAKDYPMVAPDYAEHRSALAKKIGLGTSGKKKPAAAVPAVGVKPERGRKKKATK